MLPFSRRKKHEKGRRIHNHNHTFYQVHFNFYDREAVWKHRGKAFDFCVLSFRRACTQALAIGRITRRMGAHLTAFVANETLLKQLKFQGSALYSSTHTYTAVNEPWLSYKMVLTYYAISESHINYSKWREKCLKIWKYDRSTRLEGFHSIKNEIMRSQFELVSTQDRVKVEEQFFHVMSLSVRFTFAGDFQDVD